MAQNKFKELYSFKQKLQKLYSPATTDINKVTCKSCKKYKLKYDKKQREIQRLREREQMVELL